MLLPCPGDVGSMNLITPEFSILGSPVCRMERKTFGDVVFPPLPRPSNPVFATDCFKHDTIRVAMAFHPRYMPKPGELRFVDTGGYVLCWVETCSAYSSYNIFVLYLILPFDV